jgi:hypothetical protein
VPHIRLAASMVRCAVAPMGDHPANRAAPPARAIAHRRGGTGAALELAQHSDVARKITWLLFRASEHVRTARAGAGRAGWLFYARIAVSARGCGDFGASSRRPATGVACSARTTAFFNRVANSGEHKARPRTTQTRPDRSPPAYISPLVVYIIII